MLEIYINHGNKSALDAINTLETNTLETNTRSLDIAWDYLDGTYYCLIIYDIDIADCQVNFLAMNILENNITDANILIAHTFEQIKTKSSHTFIVDLYLQRMKIDQFDRIKELDLEFNYCSKAENFIFEANIELIERTTFVI